MSQSKTDTLPTYVYILESCYIWDDVWMTEGVFSTAEKAERYIEKQEELWQEDHEEKFFNIDERKLDEEL